MTVREQGEADINLLETFPSVEGEQTYDAIVKFRLVHAPGRSVFLPDLIALTGSEPLWFQPANFGPPLLSFYGDQAYAQFDVGTDHGDRLMIATTDSRHIRSMLDGSHLYQCKIRSKPCLANRATGWYRLRSDGGIDLRLFHHTAPATLPLIQASQKVLGSEWNYQGNTKLENVHYAYFTSLSKIENEIDLQRIAMASRGVIYVLVDDHTPPSGIVPIKVYRESTSNRAATLALWIPSEIVSPSHVWRHEPYGEPVWYEVAHPSIHRIGLKPGKSLPIDGGNAVVDDAHIKRFTYVVIGDATDRFGITAPFHEEDTSAIFKIEMAATPDPLTFWRMNANQDHFSGKAVEFQRTQNT